MNQRRLPSRSQRRGRNVAKSGHVTNGSRGKANAAGKKSVQTAGKKSKASGPAPSPAHMERDLKGKPARRNQRNGQHDTANRLPEKKKAGNKQRQTKTRETGREKKSEQNRTKQRASGREHNKNGNGNDAHQHQIPSPPEVWRPGGEAGQWNRREEHFEEGWRFAGRAGFVRRRGP